MQKGRLIRLAENDREQIPFIFDGQPFHGLAGDTVLTAVLMVTGVLRQAEFGPEKRAGFCLMGACQDCWIWQEDGVRVRACSTPLKAGMQLCSAVPDSWPTMSEHDEKA